MVRTMSKYTLPRGRIPKAFNQNLPGTDVGSCVACTFTKILEVINFIKTGEYIELSKGYMYGRNNYKGKRNPGMSEEYTLDVMLQRGTVPVSMCSDYDEIPDIVKILENRSDIAQLDKAAEEYKLNGWENISCNNSKDRFEKVKEYLKKHEMPLAGTIKKYKGEKHSVVIVGYEDDYILFHNHTGSDELEKVKYDRFSKAYYLDGDVEVKNANTTQEVDNMGYKLIDVNDFKNYLDSLKITRKITVIQLHHTYSPAYRDFNGDNHIKLQNSMRNYHVKPRGYSDIAQTFTIFPDGKICTGRDINTAPAGIYGANSTGVCIECVGNFDGTDTMTEAQKNAIAGAVKILLDKFGLNARTGVTYHAWWTSGGTALGTYIAGRSVKTCPGTKFFGGNTREAYEKNLLPLIENYGKEKKPMLESANDITWELNHTYFPITDMEGFVKALDDAKQNNSPLYWGYYKLVNRIK